MALCTQAARTRKIQAAPVSLPGVNAYAVPAQNKLGPKFRPLTLGPSDIQYLILPDDRVERGALKLHDFALETFSRRFGRTQAVLATTAIMTENCIARNYQV